MTGLWGDVEEYKMPMYFRVVSVCSTAYEPDPVWSPTAEKQEECPWCGQTSPDDELGGCKACGGPRKRSNETEKEWDRRSDEHIRYLENSVVPERDRRSFVRKLVDAIANIFTGRELGCD